jgi:hypothetical protein
VKKFFIIKKMFYFCFQTRSEENIRAPKIVSWVKG